jgi:ribosomal 30S subunit maturation factor RimM
VAGAFAVENASEAPERFAVGARLLAGGKPTVVVESKCSGGRRIVRLDVRVERGTELAVDASELAPPAEGAYYVFQLVGLPVVDEAGIRVGCVQDVVPGVANDVIELDTGLAIPFVDDWVPVVDLERGRIVVRAERFGD